MAMRSGRFMRGEWARRLWAAAAALGVAAYAPAAAAGVPGTLTHQGRLYDANDKPISSTLSIQFAIYADAAATTPLWTETDTVAFDDGYFSLALGVATPFTAGLFDGSVRYLGVTVGGDPEMTPRVAVRSVPYAMVTSDAIGDIHPTSVSIGGTTVIDASGKWVGSTTGMAGPTGAQGATGAQGPTGADGATGPAGADGAQGATGPQGPAGLQGPAGPQGSVGATGPAGAQGPFGPVGPQGPAGIDGAAGPPGPAGIDGAAGATGPQGPMGPTGADGLLPSGGRPGVVPYWDGTSWVVNGTALYDTGTGVGINTTSPGGELAVQSGTTSQTDQNALFTGTTALPSVGVLEVGQSFTAGVNGLLTTVLGALHTPCAPSTAVPATVSIYAGAGYNGPPIATAAVSLSISGSYTASFTPPPPITAGSVYSIRIVLPTTPPVGCTYSSDWIYASANVYSGGTMLSGSGATPVAANDLSFRTVCIRAALLVRNGEVMIHDGGGSTPPRSMDGSIATSNNGFPRIYFRTGGVNAFVSYSGSGDLSEYFRTADRTLAAGEVVAPDPDLANGVRRARPRDAALTVGIVSRSGSRGNDDREGRRGEDPDYVNVGLTGQVPVLVSTENGPIAPGDPLTVSARWRGRVAKAVGRARILGTALTHFPYVAGEKDYLDDPLGGAEHRLTDDHVMCALGPGWYEPAAQAGDGEIKPARR